MTQIITNGVPTKVALTPASTTPANGYYTVVPYVPTVQLPLDCILEVTSTCGAITPSPSTVVYVFLKISMDGTLYGTGPESSNSTTDENQLIPLGPVPHTTASQAVTEFFSLKDKGVPIPFEKAKIIFRNATGAALTGLAVNMYENAVVIT